MSSAVVSVTQGERDAVRANVEALDGVEVHGGDATRLIVTIEGTSTGQLGDRLTEINLMPGVLVANMVFEHAEEADDTEEPQCHST
ncbi:periplasmic nitrate reductase, NapD protein [Salipiger mucosus DSM 16094]|uniref:Periplasmic nitrate reductase, NapD protein n=1 Tax=Salipiger mucosus DSM 16094 TaxID=1123237 RepID=S9QED6_9RHOB|nr:periplasmic nitrate reductase, NapD protein [Salipiger mucosus DSM 16094]